MGEVACQEVTLKEMKPRPHALVIPFPAQGHIGPMMHFSIKLAAEQGYMITFANTQFNHALLKKEMEPALNKYKPLEAGQIRFVEVPFSGRDSGDTTGAQSIIELCQAMFSIQPNLEELIETLSVSGTPLTSIVSDLYLYFTQDVANKYKLPRLAFWTASAGTIASIMAVCKHGHRSPPEPEKITWIPGVPPLKHSELNTYLQSFDDTEFIFHHMYMTAYHRLSETTWISVNTFDELEGVTAAALQHDNPTTPIYTIGPLLPSPFFDQNPNPNSNLREQQLQEYPHAALWHEDDACMKWLNAHLPESVLYVSFGSIAVLSKSQFHELALRLEASGSPLLWVIRPDLLHGEDSVFPDGYLDRMGQNRVCFVDWAPQLQVLSHASVGGFLTHCGWNSTLESISAGVPMLGWPYFADQMLNNRCCVDGWGVGLELDAATPTAAGFGSGEIIVQKEEIEGKVHVLMSTQSSVRVNAKKWKAAAFDARAAPSGSSYLNWNSLVNSMNQGTK